MQDCKQEIHPVSAVASGRLNYNGHYRTRSDLKGSHKNLIETKESTVRGHFRKKSHQDYMLKLETEIPSFIRKNIKNLIANRINTESVVTSRMRTAETGIRLIQKPRQNISRPTPTGDISTRLVPIVPNNIGRCYSLSDSERLASANVDFM
jgi:hypothetical protein